MARKSTFASGTGIKLTPELIAALQQAGSIVTAKQDTLVSGENIKTINQQSVLGSGDIAVEGGSGITLTQVKEDTDIASAISLKHASGSDNQDLSGLQPKETGKGLYPDADASKLAGIESGANNYTHPINHAASVITQDASNRFVTDEEKSTWNSAGGLTQQQIEGMI